MKAEDLEVMYRSLKEFAEPLQPVLDPPSHLRDVRGFVEYRPNEQKVEVTIFFRPKFLKVTYKNGDVKVGPKLRVDFEMTYDEFFYADDYNALRAWMLYVVSKISPNDIENIPNVEFVEYAFNGKPNLQDATGVVGHGVKL